MSPVKDLSPRPASGTAPLKVPGGWRAQVWQVIVRARAPFFPVTTAAMSLGLRLMVHLGPPWFLKMLGRPQWLFESSVPIPHRPLTLTEPPATSRDGLELCARSIDAYRPRARQNRAATADPEGADALEIAAGFGGVSMWYLRLLGGDAGTYTIVDLPLMNAFQACFLGMQYGGENLSLHGEDRPAAQVTISPPELLSSPDAVADVVFNQDSMPETAARGYLRWMSDNLSGLFVSSNQEVGTVGVVEQVVVSELASEYENLSRISRQTSWTRRGYVEEVYRCDGRPG